MAASVVGCSPIQSAAAERDEDTELETEGAATEDALGTDAIDEPPETQKAFSLSDLAIANDVAADDVTTASDAAAPSAHESFWADATSTRALAAAVSADVEVAVSSTSASQQPEPEAMLGEESVFDSLSQLEQGRQPEKDSLSLDEPGNDVQLIRTIDVVPERIMSSSSEAAANEPLRIESSGSEEWCPGSAAAQTSVSVIACSASAVDVQGVDTSTAVPYFEACGRTVGGPSPTQPRCDMRRAQTDEFTEKFRKRFHMAQERATLRSRSPRTASEPA